MILNVNTESNNWRDNLDACIKAVNASGLDHSDFSWGKENKLCVNGKLKQFELDDFITEWAIGGEFQARALTNAIK